MTTYARFPTYFTGTSALAELPNGVTVRSRTAVTFLSVSLNSCFVTSTFLGIVYTSKQHHRISMDILKNVSFVFCFGGLFMTDVKKKKQKRWGKKFKDNRD